MPRISCGHGQVSVSGDKYVRGLCGETLGKILDWERAQQRGCHYRTRGPSLTPPVQMNFR